MGDHLIDGEFQSDKYPTTPRGKVPLSCKDVTAQDLLWEYAQRRRSVDAEFAADLEFALTRAGYVPAAAIRAIALPAAATDGDAVESDELWGAVEVLMQSYCRDDEAVGFTIQVSPHYSVFNSRDVGKAWDTLHQYRQAKRAALARGRGENTP